MVKRCAGDNIELRGRDGTSDALTEPRPHPHRGSSWGVR